MASLKDSVAVYKAIGEQSRLRLLALLASGELTVKDLTDILGQSQPHGHPHQAGDCRGVTAPAAKGGRAQQHSAPPLEELDGGVDERLGLLFVRCVAGVEQL